MIDYRKLRPGNLTTPEFSHLLWLLFWPVFGIAFSLVEKLRPLEDCHPVWIPLDDLIPFNEWFLLPYMFWFVFLGGMVFYLVLFDAKALRRFMQFIMVTYTVTMVVYLIYPTCQNLRPTSFARDNFLTRFMAGFYAFDTNTNVCPSIHVIGSMAAAFGAWDTPRFQTKLWKFSFMAMALLISVSTVFVKQHSVADVFWAFVVCAVGYTVIYALPKKEKAFQASPQHV